MTTDMEKANQLQFTDPPSSSTCCALAACSHEVTDATASCSNQPAPPPVCAVCTPIGKLMAKAENDNTMHRIWLGPDWQKAATPGLKLDGETCKQCHGQVLYACTDCVRILICICRHQLRELQQTAQDRRDGRLQSPKALLEQDDYAHAFLSQLDHQLMNLL